MELPCSLLPCPLKIQIQKNGDKIRRSRLPFQCSASGTRQAEMERLVSRELARAGFRELVNTRQFFPQRFPLERGQSFANHSPFTLIGFLVDDMKQESGSTTHKAITICQRETEKRERLHQERKPASSQPWSCPRRIG